MKSRGTTNKMGNARKVNTGIRLPPELMARLDLLAEISPLMKKAEVVRLCVISYLPEIEREFGIKTNPSVTDTVDRMSLAVEAMARLHRKRETARKQDTAQTQ